MIIIIIIAIVFIVTITTIIAIMIIIADTWCSAQCMWLLVCFLMVCDVLPMSLVIVLV